MAWHWMWRISVCACIIAYFTLCPRPASAAIVADSPASSAATAAQAISLSWSHTVGTNPGRILIVGVSLRDGNTSVQSVKFGAASLTVLGTQNGPGNQNRSEMWYLLAPASGTATITVTLTQAKAIAAGAVSFSGVVQSAPSVASASGGTSAASVAIASATGSVVIDTITANGDANSLTAGGAQTVRWSTWSGNGDASNARGAASTQPGASSVTMSWTLGASKPWTMVAASLTAGAAPAVQLSLSCTSAPCSGPVSGNDLAYSVTYTNNGSDVAQQLVVKQTVPADTWWKLGSAGFTLPSSGLTSCTVTYSNDGGVTFTYTPVSGAGGAAAGYDATVTTVRWTFTGTLSFSSPANSGTVTYTVGVQ